jgi:hypothetical protein
VWGCVWLDFNRLIDHALERYGRRDTNRNHPGGSRGPEPDRDEHRRLRDHAQEMIKVEAESLMNADFRDWNGAIQAES